MTERDHISLWRAMERNVVSLEYSTQW